MTDKQKKAVGIGAVIIFIVFCALVGWLVGVPMIRMASEPEQFRAWVDGYGLLGKVVFVGMVVLQVLVAFIPGEPIELAAGYAFGFLEGSLLTLAGFLIGSAMVYALVKRFGVKLVEVFFDRKKINEFSFLKNPKKTRAIALILMTIPGTPKDFLSYFAGLTQLKLEEWLAIVAIGRLPSLITSTVTGAAAGSENYVLSIVMLGVTLLITAVGAIYYRCISKQQREEESQNV
ncbi:MAG: TVP38/TMEM64 family protein [Oscillospiraceae bacterium]|nr:TVP38/TMEM64 family protein [Oscillospiraceae bacterium]